MRTHVKYGYSCTGKYEYGGAPRYRTFECSDFALWYRYPTLCSVSCASSKPWEILYGALYRLWPRHPPVFTGICGGDHAGDDTSSYGYSRPLTISTDLWGVSNFQQGRDFCKQTAAWVSAHRQPSNHSIATVLYYLTQDEAPLNGHISETVIGAHPCSWLDVHRVSRLGVQAAESATTDCLALCTTANLPLTE
jgi:hypothetical protein